MAMLFDAIASCIPIEKGFSSDKKFLATTDNGLRYLLRISSQEQYESKKILFEMMQKVSMLNIPMCKPVEFGTCDEGVYTLFTWVDGKDAVDIVPILPETEQYVLGIKAGEILKKIHSIPAQKMQEDWETRFNRKTDYEIQKYHECGLRFDGDEKIIEYIENNRHLLEKRPDSLQHGDYGLGNLMYANSEIYAIDFSLDYGDPWQDFESIRWMVDKSIYFATGMVDGYFNKEVPFEFWKLLRFYLSEGCFHNIVWSIGTGEQSQIDTTLRQISDVQNWYDNIQTDIPSWYISHAK